MPARLLALLCCLATGCRQFAPPEAPKSVCTDDGGCGSNRCFADSDCDTNTCVGAQNGVAGTCATRVCNGDSDCVPDKICELEGTSFICVTGCHTDAQCTAIETCVNVSGSLVCAGNCRSDADCPADKSCTRFVDGGVPTCTPNSVDSFCHADTDCPGCEVCSSHAVDAGGVCFSVGDLVDGGPAIQGVPTALAFDDNLDAAVGFVESNLPGADLAQVTGIGLQPGGTVDITNSNGSAWLYLFTLPDGGAVGMYYNAVSTKCGELVNATQILPPPIPAAVLPTLKTPAQLEAAFLGHAGCVDWAGEQNDVIEYKGSDAGGVDVVLTTSAGGAFVGDGVTGQGNVSCQ